MGGRSGGETVLRALERVGDEASHVAVHDAARPLVSRQLIDRCFAALRDHDAVVPGVPVTDTLKRLGSGCGCGRCCTRGIDPRPPRAGGGADAAVFRAIAAPAGLCVAGAGAEFDASTVTDDASLVEALGEPVWVAEGDRRNMKVTLPGDVTLAEAMLNAGV